MGLLGLGNVGQAVVRLAAREGTRLRESAGLELRFERALVRNRRKPRETGDVSLTVEGGHAIRDADVVVEVLGGLEPARTLIADALSRGVPVVTANKTVVARHGAELERLAAENGTTLAYDAAVVAGVPFLGALTGRPLFARVERIEAVLNGTSHALLEAMGQGSSLEVALAEAVVLGLAEPDSEADTSGRDAAEKLAILLRLAGVAIDVAAIPRTGITGVRPSTLAAARAQGGVLKPVAVASLASDRPELWVGPAFVGDDHPFARLRGAENAVRLFDERGRVVTFAGPGAGPDVTARTILDDLVQVVHHGTRRDRPQRATGERPLPPCGPLARAWFVAPGDGTPYPVLGALPLAAVIGQPA